jgi:hypothetical protein
MHRDLEDGEGTLSKHRISQHTSQKEKAVPRNNGTPGQEEHPDSPPPIAVLFLDLGLVLEPVLVPPVDGRAVVDAEDVARADFKVGGLELVDYPACIELSKRKIVGRGKTHLKKQKRPHPGRYTCS